ncbi:MAG: helix-turn-helix domain-containing protein [Chitinophagales bacterium]|nr:helix-turn-helix domain-containing protein [Chitinophagales bacterium]
MPENTLHSILEVIGRNLSNFRDLRKDKLDTVARCTGISEPTLSKIENGRYHSLGVRILTKLSIYYSKSISEIVSDQK